MKSSQTILMTVFFIAAAFSSHAATITSTISGGLWSSASSWDGGEVPGSDDEVVIAGPVQVDGAVPCSRLVIEATGTLTAALQSPPLKVLVAGDVFNEGTIDDGAVWLDLEIGGSLHNAGAWNNHRTTLTGHQDREMSDLLSAGFACEFATAPGSTGNILLTTPTTLHGAVDFGALQLALQPGAHLTLDGSIFTANVLAAGNQVRFLSWSYLLQCTLDNAVLVGEARVASAVFTDRLVVKDSLQNTTATGGGSAEVQGHLINHGVIQNNNYSFFFRVHGDVENYGTLDMPNLEFMGVGVEHRLHMGPEAVLTANVFLPEFQASTLIADSPVTFGGGLSLGVGQLILEPGASLHFSTHSGLGSGSVVANGNTITTETGNSGLSQVTIDRGVIGSYAAVFGDVHCTGGLQVQGHLSGWPWAEAEVTVEGLLRVDGEISDGDHPVNITALNDVQNLGDMSGARLVLAGTGDQFVAAGPGIAVPEVVLQSHLNGASYQWYRNGQELSGESDANLTLNTLGAANYGRYHCETPTQVSRNVWIAETLGAADVPDLLAATLDQNHPNPFNPATNLAYSLAQAGPVTLTVFDLAGRVVDRLVDQHMPAGRHQVTWQPQNLASGTYFYRLQTVGGEFVRKCSLLK